MCYLCFLHLLCQLVIAVELIAKDDAFALLYIILMGGVACCLDTG